MAFIPRPQEIYRHFKGNLYQIVAIAEHSETGEQLVVYQALYGDFRTYARPLTMFLSEVDRSKYPDVAQKFRFELQGPESFRQTAEPVCEQAGGASVDSGQAEQAETVTAEVAKAEEAAEEATEEAAEEPDIDPMVLAFLDADSYSQRLNILSGLRHRITDEMITTMAIACDIEVNDGEPEERYESLKGCLQTLERYECNRMR